MELSLERNPSHSLRIETTRRCGVLCQNCCACEQERLWRSIYIFPAQSDCYATVVMSTMVECRQFCFRYKNTREKRQVCTARPPSNHHHKIQVEHRAYLIHYPYFAPRIRLNMAWKQRIFSLDFLAIMLLMSTANVSFVIECLDIQTFLFALVVFNASTGVIMVKPIPWLWTKEIVSFHQYSKYCHSMSHCTMLH